MGRAMVGACLGAMCGVAALAAAGVVEGFTCGGEAVARPSLPPGVSAALLGAFVYAAYFWWLGGAVGALIGGLAGLASWLVRPRTSAPRRTRPSARPR